jgi:arylsulfatase A-like enzyme
MQPLNLIPRLVCRAVVLILPAIMVSPLAAGDRPNILFIFTDDHAAHAISAYGSRINRTPNIDRIAAQGIRFDRCLVTNSLCAPSRAVIQTGKLSHLNGVYTNVERFDGTRLTFPKLLRKAGYQTAMIGKWHLKCRPTGFDFWRVLPGQGVYYNPRFRTPEGDVRITGYTTDIITETALDWLKNRRDKSRPFLLMCQHKAPHRDWQPGPNHLTLYDGVTIPEPPDLFDDYRGRATPAHRQRMTVANHMWPRDLKLVTPKNLTREQRAKWDAAYGPRNRAFKAMKLEGRAKARWQYQRYIKDYLRCVAAVDDGIGRILDYLDEAGLTDNTVVVYSSDQGFFLGDHGWYDKRWMYEESLKMPLLVRWPGTIRPGSVDDHLVQNLDFAPTFLDAAGIRPPDGMQGRSLLPLLRGESPRDWRRSVYYHYYEEDGHGVTEHYGVATRRYKLIHYFKYGEWELFDLEKDPGEMKSVYGDPAYAKVQETLEHELTRLARKYGEPDPEAHFAKFVQAKIRKRARGVKLKEVFDLARPDGKQRRKLDPSARPLTVGARCTPATGNGVILSHGGDVQGYSLYLKDGVPRFATRWSRLRREVRAPNPVKLNRPVHLAAMLDAGGRMLLFVDGKQVAAGPGLFIRHRPRDGLVIGDDLETAVGRYPVPNPFRGRLEDIRLYWGVLDPESLAEWVHGF